MAPSQRELSAKLYLGSFLDIAVGVGLLAD